MRRLLPLLWLPFALFFAWAWYDRYWRWRDCFNELGRCFDPTEGVVYLEQSGVIWGGTAALCIAGFLISLALGLRRRR